MNMIEQRARLRREKDILDRLENVRRLIQMETTLETAEGCEYYSVYKNYVLETKEAFGKHLLDDLRDNIQFQLLSIAALCYGDNPDIGEPVPMLCWKHKQGEETHPADRFRDMWEDCLEWNA